MAAPRQDHGRMPPAGYDEGSVYLEHQGKLPGSTPRKWPGETLFEPWAVEP
jgi:hypothetical protein